jgi:hypothetical protein
MSKSGLFIKARKINDLTGELNMKALILAVVTVASLSAWSQEDQNRKERVILKDSKTFPAEVSVNTVRCTEVGYGAKELKINLAGLDGWTLFDHTNSHVGEFGEPCMTAGQCKAPWNKEGFTIDDLIQNRPGTEIITVQREVLEIKQVIQDQQGNLGCERSLQENLVTSVRGITFRHTRWGAEQNFPIEVCRK